MPGYNVFSWFSGIIPCPSIPVDGIMRMVLKKLINWESALQNAGLYQA